ncbi:MAG: STN domain-containing protein [Chryseolinea sp.]
MVRHLHWKVRAVRRLFSLAGLLHIFSFVYSQSAGNTKINCSFSSTPLETAITFLSNQSGINFVYSSNKIDVAKRVSLSVRDKTLTEVLGLIGKQVDMVFRIEGHHVTIKGDETLNSHSAISLASRKINVSDVPQSLPAASESLIKYYAPQVPPTSTLLSRQSNLKREFERLQPYFDSIFLKRVSAHYIRKITSQSVHSGLFISAGATINDFSTGLELQAGIRQIYVVFAPGWLKNGDYHAAYGLGSSFYLTHNFSFNPVYLFGTISGSESYFRINKYSYPSQILIQHNVRHHQLKLMLEYAITPNVLVKLGPTLNQTSTTYEYHEMPIIITQLVRGDPYSHDVKFHYENTTGTSTATGKAPIYEDFHMSDFRIGWEASISFKLNFFPRKIVAASH